MAWLSVILKGVMDFVQGFLTPFLLGKERQKNAQLKAENEVLKKGKHSMLALVILAVFLSGCATSPSVSSCPPFPIPSLEVVDLLEQAFPPVQVQTAQGEQTLYSPVVHWLEDLLILQTK